MMHSTAFFPCPIELIKIGGWNAYISAKPMRVLRWNGRSGEEFPKPEHPLSKGAK